jgi:hypothetical protein
MATDPIETSTILAEGDYPDARAGYRQRVRTSYSGRGAPYGYRRPRWRRPLIVLTVIAVLLAVGGYVAYSAYQRFVQQILTIPGCQAGTGANAIGLDFGQAADAATIAGVAEREGLPARAVTIAYATAQQESKLENLTYGDRDSVGIFQQRPSEGWGSTTQLEDPAYAAGAFFGALVKVPDYTTIPVGVAAQDVQHSADADGSAYQQYAQYGALLSADFLAAPHAVTCWYNPATQAADSGVSAKLNLKGALNGLADAFGKPGAGNVVRKVETSAGSTVITAASGGRWAVANWLVANASSFGITRVSYAGYSWTAGLSETSWQTDSPPATGGIVAS